MNGVLVGILTVVPVLLGAAVGVRVGGGRSFSWLVKSALAACSGAGVAFYGIRQQWHQPWGLITPLIAGLLVAIVVRFLLQQTLRPKRNRQAGKPGTCQRASGALLGACVGFALAILGWQSVLLTSTRTAAQPIAEIDSDEKPVQQAKAKNALTGLAELAYDGFIQHLPVAGPMTAEVVAVNSILNKPQTLRKDFAKYKEWDNLANLPSFQAIVEDETLLDELRKAAEGNLAALYRLQRNPRVIEFYREEPLQAIVTNLKATQIAYELEEFQRSSDSQ